MLSWLCKYWVRVHFDWPFGWVFCSKCWQVPVNSGTWEVRPGDPEFKVIFRDCVVNLGYLRPCQKTKQNGVGRIKLNWFLSKCFIWHLKQKLSDFLKHKFTSRKSTQNSIPPKLTGPWSATLLELIRGVCKVSIPEFTLNTFYLKLPF